LKILFTNTGAWGTGSFYAIDALAREYISKGHQCQIFFPDSGHKTHDKAKYYNDRLYKIWQFPIKQDSVEIKDFPLFIPDPNPRSHGATFKNLTHAELRLYLNNFSKEIQKTCGKFQPDLVDSQHIWAMAYALAKLNYPYVISSHNSDQLAFEYDKNMQKYAVIAAKKAKCIFALTDPSKVRIAKLYDIPHDKIFVVSNGYNKNIFKPNTYNRQNVLNELNIENIPHDAQIVTFAGKMSHTKGIDILLMANKFLKHHNIHFVLFGSGDIKNVVDVTDTTKYCLNNMHFVGHKDPVLIAKTHNIARLNVMPSRSEGFSLSCLEAMACGLPIVFTPCDDVDKFVVGRKIAHENPQQLADAIIDIVNLAQAKYIQLSNQAIKTAQQYAWEEIAAQKLKIYQNIIDA
jgi:glycosyltransferase involved in cell wall biosynthesis